MTIVLFGLNLLLIELTNLIQPNLEDKNIL